MKNVTTENQDFIEIQFSKKLIRLYFKEFDTDINLDDITMIHYDNIIGEILTISVLLNRIGLLRAEMESKASEEELDLRIFEAQVKAEYRKKLGNFKTEKSGNQSWKNPTIGEIEDSVITDTRIVAKSKRLIKIKKDFAIIDALYWSVKSKDQKLNKISEKLRPEEFEKDIIESTVNGIIIKKFNKLIK